jgi:sigma-E factor negative regulatory protein RseA
MDGSEMGTKFEERVSALVDSELTSFESRRLITELEKDAALKERWGRYHLIGDVLRDEMPREVDLSFASKVMDRINEEVAPGSLSIKENAWLKPLAGVAITATVAVVSLLGLKNLTSEGGLSPEQIAASERAAPTQPVVADTGANGMVQPVSIEKSNIEGSQGKAEILKPVMSDPRMNSYLATHAEFAAGPGILPRVRVIGFEAVEQ